MKKGDKIQVTCTYDDLRSIGLYGPFARSILCREKLFYVRKCEYNNDKSFIKIGSAATFWIYNKWIKKASNQLEFSFMRE